MSDLEGCAPSGSLRRESVILSFPACRSCLYACIHGPFLSLQSTSLQPLIPCTDWLILHPSYDDPGDYSGPTHIIWDDLPILRSCIWSHLQSLLCHITQYIHRFWALVHGYLSLSSLPQCMYSGWQNMSNHKISTNKSNKSLLNISLDYQFSVHSLQQELESSQLVTELIIGINKV